METKIPNTKKKFIWAKNPQVEEQLLEIINAKYLTQMRSKSVPLAIWDSIAKEIGNSSLSGSSIRSYFRTLKKTFLDPSTSSKTLKNTSLLKSIFEDQLPTVANQEILGPVSPKEPKQDNESWLKFNIEAEICVLCNEKVSQLNPDNRLDHFAQCANAILQFDPFLEPRMAPLLVIRESLTTMTQCPFCKDHWRSEVDSKFKLNHLQTCGEYHKVTLETIFERLKANDFKNEKVVKMPFNLPNTPVLLRKDGSITSKLNAFELIKHPGKHLKTRILEPRHANEYLTSRAAHMIEKTKVTETYKGSGLKKVLRNMASVNEANDKVESNSLWVACGAGIDQSLVEMRDEDLDSDIIAPLKESPNKRPSNDEPEVLKLSVANEANEVISSIALAENFNSPIVIPSTPIIQSSNPRALFKKIKILQSPIIGKDELAYKPYDSSPLMLSRSPLLEATSPLITAKSVAKKLLNTPAQISGLRNEFHVSGDFLRIDTPEKSMTPQGEDSDSIKIESPLLKPIRIKSTKDIYTEFQNEIYARRQEVTNEMSKLKKIYKDWVI